MQATSVIINADDFGMNPGVTDAIVDCFLRGAITSTTLMVDGEDAQRAAKLACKHNIPTGLHLCLDTTKYFLNPYPIRSIMKLRWIGSILTGPWLTEMDKDMKEVVAQIVSQLSFFEKVGLKLSHMDSHHHVHCRPAMVALLLHKKQMFPRKIRTIRNFEGSKRFSQYGMLRSCYKKSVHALFQKNFTTTDYFSGIQNYRTGEFDSIDRFLNSPPAATMEVMCHPGEPDDFEFLISPGWQKAVAKRNLNLISFHEL